MAKIDVTLIKFEQLRTNWKVGTISFLLHVDVFKIICHVKFVPLNLLNFAIFFAYQIYARCIVIN